MRNALPTKDIDDDHDLMTIVNKSRARKWRVRGVDTLKEMTPGRPRPSPAVIDRLSSSCPRFFPTPLQEDSYCTANTACQVEDSQSPQVKFRGVLVFEAHELFYHSTLGLM